MNAPVREKLTAAIAEAWSSAETNAEARDRLLAIMARDPEVMALATEPHLAQIAMDLVARDKRAHRAYLWNRPTEPDARVGALTRINAVSMYDFRLQSGKRLGDATRDDVVECVASYDAQASALKIKADFLSRIAARMKDGQIVREVFTADELERMKE